MQTRDVLYELLVDTANYRVVVKGMRAAKGILSRKSCWLSVQPWQLRVGGSWSRFSYVLIKIVSVISGEIASVLGTQGVLKNNFLEKTDIGGAEAKANHWSVYRERCPFYRRPIL